MSQFSTAEAQLPALMVESVFYGIYLITSFACLQRLLWDSNADWKPRRNINIPTISIILLLLISSSMSLSLTFVRNMDIFVHRPEHNESLGVNQPAHASLNLLKSATLTLQTVIADCVLVYRCWLIWNRSFVVLFIPLVGWLGTLACGICILYYRMMLQLGSNVHMNTLATVRTAFWGTTIFVNTFSSSLILWKIWKAERAWSPPSICSIRDIPQRSRLQFARRTLIESGLIYTSTTIVVFFVHLCAGNAAYITNAAEVQITGIAFNLIIMRAASPYPNRVDSAPVSRMTGFVSSERSELRSRVDVAVMTTEDWGFSCDQSTALSYR